MKHRPIAHQVLVRIDKEASEHACYEDKGEFDIIVMPENIEKQFRFTGWVEATGPKTVEGLMPGEYVIFDTYRQLLFTMTGSPHQYAYIDEDSIITVLSEAPKSISVVVKGTREIAGTV